MPYVLALLMPVSSPRIIIKDHDQSADFFNINLDLSTSSEMRKGYRTIRQYINTRMQADIFGLVNVASCNVKGLEDPTCQSRNKGTEPFEQLEPQTPAVEMQKRFVKRNRFFISSLPPQCFNALPVLAEQTGNLQ